MDGSYILPSPPVVYKNLVITGAGTGEGPGGSNAAPAAGDTRAWESRTGKLVWTFHTVPRPGEFGYDTWDAESRQEPFRRQCLGLHDGRCQARHRLHAAGRAQQRPRRRRPSGQQSVQLLLVAVDANTGKYLWHFQVTHHDIWDYDTQSRRCWWT